MHLFPLQDQFWDSLPCNDDVELITLLPWQRGCVNDLARPDGEASTKVANQELFYKRFPRSAAVEHMAGIGWDL